MSEEGTLATFLDDLSSSEYEKGEEMTKIVIKLPSWRWRSVAITIVLVLAAFGMFLPIAAH